MISPWSTNPKTTEGKKYVFRACFLGKLHHDRHGPAGYLL